MKKLFIGVMALGLAPLAFANGYAPAPAPAVAPAVPAFVPGVYVGLQAGYGVTNWDSIEGSHTDYHVSSDTGFAGRVFLGYDFHPNFAVEAGYTYFFTSPKVKVGGQQIYKGNDPWAIDLVGKIKAHVVDNFGLYAKAGGSYLDNKLKAEGSKQGTSDLGGNAFNVTYGVGAFYDITPNITADLSWTRYNGKIKQDAKYLPYMDFYDVGVYYKFDLS